MACIAIAPRGGRCGSLVIERSIAADVNGCGLAAVAWRAAVQERSAASARGDVSARRGIGSRCASVIKSLQPGKYPIENCEINASSTGTSWASDTGGAGRTGVPSGIVGRNA